MARKRLATAVKERNGSFIVNPGRRNKREPTPKAGKPRMPVNVSQRPAAKKYWNRIVKTLEEMDVLNQSDSFVIEQIALAYAGQMESLQVIEQEGKLINDGKRQHPLLIEYHKHQAAVNKLLPELGLTGASRSKLHVNATYEPDLLQEFLEAGNQN